MIAVVVAMSLNGAISTSAGTLAGMPRELGTAPGNGAGACVHCVLMSAWSLMPW
ncbi:MAG: hypothetical protein ABIR79_06715 [Candidatus Binatia bacterium]